MKIVACLGNPGKRYYNTRHNIGFLVGEYIGRENFVTSLKSEFKGKTAKVTISGEDLLLLFPETFMNASGESVMAALKFYRLTVDDLIVVHDELELSFGEVRKKNGGGHKGHNGIRSIIHVTGSPDFTRIRCGIGRPPHESIGVADFVLSTFTKEEKSELDFMYEKAYSAITEIVQGA